ncbi:dihydrofolate reductase [Microbacterium excoecariae]|uniref:dihydrofolate reductase n=1 Tax=Microbacterium excoecariae TaxID=2715210 RepID=UPI00140CFE76|nr:dihydrofolate reductase [Microbacterium excoecariae]NHI16447.1 dihydrofolate reductase [Microbacterium excoecariae]
MPLRAIWAQARGGVLGADGGMPWHVPEDLAYFQRATMGAPVVMGRRTWQSFPDRFRPLPGRANIVVTRDATFAAPGGETAPSLEAALERAATLAADAWVIGGGQIYARAMDLVDELWVTEIDLDAEGDTTAPAIGPAWRVASRDPAAGGWHTSRTGVRYRFVVYERASEPR